MRSVILGALGCISSLVPSVMALNVPRPKYAVAELLVVPNNVTLMTPHDTSSMLGRQLLDFGSPFSSGFSGLRHLATRQGCGAANEVCQNDPTTCCQIGGDCCGGGICCKAGSFCYGGGCCLSTKVGCNNKGCCDIDANCCTGGGCCASGSHCVTINGKLGCCPDGQTCISEPQCNRTGYSPCANETFCCPTGFVCSRDPANEPLCRDPNSQTATSIPATQHEPTTTRVAISQTSTVTHTHHSSIGETLPPSHLPTSPETSPTGIHDQTTEIEQPSPTSGPGSIFAQSRSPTNVGAIAGGTVAGVVTLAIMLMVLILWRRKQSNGAAGSEMPAAGPASGPSDNHAYSPNAVPPIPGTVDPFLTPMNQYPNLGVSYFAGPGPVDRPVSGAGSLPHYNGLPEPQHGDDMGVAAGTSTMPTPRHDLHHPYPLPMSVTPLREPTAEPGPTRVWSGFIPSPPNTARGDGSTPTPSGWSNHERTNTNSVYSNPPAASNAYGSTPPPRAPSTIYQPSQGGEYAGSSDLYSPPASPPPESLYPRAFAGNFGGLPDGAAPPVTNFTQ